MKIVLVEDDKIQADWIFEILNMEFPDISLEQVWTESDFGNGIATYIESPPDLFIIDAMLPWADPSPNMPISPDKVLIEGYYRAGLRCVEHLTDHPQLRSVPTILYTILDKKDLKNEFKQPSSQQIHYVQKGSPLGKDLINAVRSFLFQPPR